MFAAAAPANCLFFTVLCDAVVVGLDVNPPVDQVEQSERKREQLARNLVDTAGLKLAVDLLGGRGRGPVVRPEPPRWRAGWRLVRDARRSGVGAALVGVVSDVDLKQTERLSGD
jgi:hypothetical protein